MSRRDLAMFLLGALVASGVMYTREHRGPAPAALPLVPEPPDAGRAVDAATDELSAALARVTASPRDPSAWIRLGDVEAAYEELDAAENAYRTALRIRPDGLAFAQLGFLLYERGREEEALRYLRDAKRLGATAPLLDETIARLGPRSGKSAASVAASDRDDRDAGASDARPSEDFDAGADGGVGSKLACKVPVRGGPKAQERGLVVEVLVDGHPAALLVDTGATVSVLNEDLAARIGLRAGSKRFGVITANGRTTFASAHASTVSLEGRTISDVLLGLCPDCVHGVADGLLGLDLQAALGLQLDLGRRELRFADCDR